MHETLRCGPQEFLNFFRHEVTYSQSNLGCVIQSMFAFSYIFGKLSWNIFDILGHDVKPCDWNLPSSRYSACILMSFASIYVAQDPTKIHAKMHVVWIFFGFLHKHFNISSILFLHVNQRWMVVFNVFHGI